MLVNFFLCLACTFICSRKRTCEIVVVGHSNYCLRLFTKMRLLFARGGWSWTKFTPRAFQCAPRVSPVVPSRHASFLLTSSQWTSAVKRPGLRGRSLLFLRRDLTTGNGEKEFRDKRKATVMFISAVGVLVLTLSYAAVPLYRLFCQAYSYGGTVMENDDVDLGALETRKDRKLRISFNADTAASLTWNFRPQQSEISVYPGETALAFYTATNNTDRPIDGIATYNVIPFEVGQYFNKIQCFCFEEQRLNPGEQVDMPVFFYIDPEFADDPKMEYINDITLSYTFFEAKEGLNLPMPAFIK